MPKVMHSKMAEKYLEPVFFEPKVSTIAPQSALNCISLYYSHKLPKWRRGGNVLGKTG